MEKPVLPQLPANFSTSDYQAIFGCSMTYDMFREHLRRIGYINDLQFAATSFAMLGPVLWTSCIIGLILNALVLLASIATNITSSSMCIMAIAGCLAMKAASSLLLFDLEQGG